jgi:hypothetical protein
MTTLRIKPIKIPKFLCPIGPDVDNVVSSAGHLRKALQKLRRDLVACQICAFGPECPKWSAYQATVRQAINTVAQEWQVSNAG